MMLSQDEVFGSCVSPSSVMKGDPFLADISSSPDIDDAFLASFENDERDWLKDDFPLNNGELYTEVETRISGPFYNCGCFSSESYVELSAGIKQTLPGDEIGLTSNSLTTGINHLEEKPFNCNELCSLDLPKDVVNNSRVSTTPSKQDSKRNFTFDPGRPIKKFDLSEEIKKFNSIRDIKKELSPGPPPAKQAKRGRPMKITSRSKQALYARAYRYKNKMALWSYEKMVAEQNEEIKELVKQNKEMSERLAIMTRQFAQMKRLIAAYPSIAAKFQELTDSAV
ncbi:unnamed protein product [Enterobius vermicularis]|uniref:BZIP domain-containing protein n=1 Tax=Enterobius vermicularis TaxID=51028 RepID=A0A0N4V7M3_ENTVE|nr:unnamed protein product [Enterobius vermicularis]